MNLFTICGPESTLMVPSTVGVSKTILTLAVYVFGGEIERKTHWFPGLAVPESFKFFVLSESCSHFSSVHMNSGRTQKGNQVTSSRALCLPANVHVLRHSSFHDTDKICHWASISNYPLAKQVEKCFGICAPCQVSGRPLHSRKLQFNLLLAKSNEHLQVEFRHIREPEKLPILILKICVQDIQWLFLWNRWIRPIVFAW